MKSKLITLFLLFVATAALAESTNPDMDSASRQQAPSPTIPVTSTGFQPAGERGCPRIKPTIGCTFDEANIKCRSHLDCSNGKLCCSVGCGKDCVNPPPTPVDPASKP